MADPEQYYEEEAYEDEGGGRLPSWITETPYWAISAVVHLILLLVLAGVILLETSATKIDSQTIVRREFKPQEYDPTKKRDVKRRPEILEKRKKNPILKLKPDKITPEIPKGIDLEKLTNKNLLADSVNDAFGVGGGPSGAYGQRWGKGSLTNEGGSEATEDAVLAALYWLKHHQHPDGHWSAKDFTEQCEDPNKPCSNKEESYTDGRGCADHDVGVTALAILAYTGYGHTHRDGIYKEFRQVVKKAMNWMLKQQVKGGDPQSQGRYGAAEGEQWIYNHAIATMAMGELLVMSRDRFKLSKSVTEATEFCLRWQNPDFGWRYKFHDANDTSVTGWMVLALKTSKACSEQRLLKIPKDTYRQHFKWALNWFDRATSASGKTGYLAPGDPGSQLQDAYPDPYPYSKDLSCMTAVAVLCRLFAGVSRRDPSIKAGVKILMAETPQWRKATGKRKSKINIYYWYYATYAMFQHGGSDWKKWNIEMKRSLLDTQRVGGDEDGSWDPIGEWGAAGGRVYSTAIGAMTLEVYYRFVRTTGGDL